LENKVIKYKKNRNKIFIAEVRVVDSDMIILIVGNNLTEKRLPVINSSLLMTSESIERLIYTSAKI